MSSPDISIILSVHNGARYLAQAIESVLAQEGADFELIVVDDGSTDETPAILARYAARDRRMVLLHNDHNQGISKSLNRALAAAQGTLIARMDADDLCLPHRLQSQQRFLRDNPAVGVVGCAYQLIDAEGNPLPQAVLTPHTHPCCVWALLYRNPFAHPTVMMHRSVLEDAGGYPLTHNSQQDLALWCRLYTRTTFANLPDVLFQYRRHGSQVTGGTRSDEINRLEVASRHSVYAHLLGEAVDEQAIVYLINQHFPDAQAASQAVALLDRLWHGIQTRYPLTSQERHWVRTECLREYARIVRAVPTAAADVIPKLRPADGAVVVRLFREKTRR